MRKIGLIGCGLVLALAMASPAAAEEVVASGNIAAGGPWTYSLDTRVSQETGVEGVDSFSFDLPAGVTKVETLTTDNSGFGYDVDLYLYNAAGDATGECSTVASDEVCDVPAGTTNGVAAAWIGFDLQVDILNITPAS